MIVADKPANVFATRSRSPAARFSSMLQDFYQDLLEQGVPEHMAALVRQLDTDAPRPGADGRPLALVVEMDGASRAQAVALLDETGLAVVECTSAEAALGILRDRGADVAFIFADQNLSGQRDGTALAVAVSKLWPRVRVVLTHDELETLPGLPDEVIAMRKPWRGLDVIRQAERALQG